MRFFLRNFRIEMKVQNMLIRHNLTGICIIFPAVLYKKNQTLPVARGSFLLRIVIIVLISGLTKEGGGGINRGQNPDELGSQTIYVLRTESSS